MTKTKTMTMKKTLHDLQLSMPLDPVFLGPLELISAKSVTATMSNNYLHQQCHLSKWSSFLLKSIQPKFFVRFYEEGDAASLVIPRDSEFRKNIDWQDENFPREVEP